MPQLSLFDAIEIPLTRGYVALVDPVDSDLLDASWCLLSNKRRYATRVKTAAVEYKTVYLHRVILARKIGRNLLPGEYADHIDSDPLNNRRSNLRIATHAQNCHNQKRRMDSRSGFKGVSWSKGMRKWNAQIRIDGKTTKLGYFDSPIDAALAYDEAARRYFGEFARCNFPGGDE